MSDATSPGKATFTFLFEQTRWQVAGSWKRANSEAATFWLGFLRGLETRGLRGVKLVISDAHEGLKAAIAQVFKATWQRCRVHFMRNTLAYVPKAQHQMVAAAIRTVLMQADQAAASKTWRQVADQLRQRIPKIWKVSIKSAVSLGPFCVCPQETGAAKL